MHGPARGPSGEEGNVEGPTTKSPEISVPQPRLAHNFAEQPSISTCEDQTGKTPEKLPLSCTTTTHNPHAPTDNFTSLRKFPRPISFSRLFAALRCAVRSLLRFDSDSRRYLYFRHIQTVKMRGEVRAHCRCPLLSVDAPNPHTALASRCCCPFWLRIPPKTIPPPPRVLLDGGGGGVGSLIASLLPNIFQRNITCHLWYHVNMNMHPVGGQDT